MPVISKKFADELGEKEMRDAYLDEKTRAKIALQIKELRAQRGWSQAELGQKMDKPQSNIARLEDRDVARYTVTTLLELASAYDCALVVEFVPYEQFLRRTNDLSPSRLQVTSFDRAALEPLCREMPTATVRAEVLYTISTHALAHHGGVLDRITRSDFGLADHTVAIQTQLAVVENMPASGIKAILVEDVATTARGYVVDPLAMSATIPIRGTKEAFHA